MPESRPPESAVDSRVDSPPHSAGDSEVPPVFLDFRLPGPELVSTWEGSYQASSGCSLEYYFAAPGSWSVLVVLLHGLERSNEQQRSAAEQLASWGVAVVAPTSCHASVLDLDQEQNARDAIGLAGALGRGPVLYAGHSAGGVASFYAAATDPDAIAFFGLDPTEWSEIAVGAAPGMLLDAYAVVGAPGICNLDNNFLPILSALPQGRALRATEADHCDFEEPTDWVCTLACGTGSNNQFSEEEIHENIVGMMTAFVVWQAGLESSGEQWWFPGGEGYDRMLVEGRISEP